MRVYVSHPMSRINEIEELFKNVNIQGIEFIRPIPLDCQNHEYFFSDIELLCSSDVLLLYLPEPTVGAPCELAIFKTKFPFRPAIGYKCLEHGWLKMLLDYQFDNFNEVIKTLENINYCITHRTF